MYLEILLHTYYKKLFYLFFRTSYKSVKYNSVVSENFWIIIHFKVQFQGCSKLSDESEREFITANIYTLWPNRTLITRIMFIVIHFAMSNIAFWLKLTNSITFSILICVLQFGQCIYNIKFKNMQPSRILKSKKTHYFFIHIQKFIWNGYLHDKFDFL